ncbi:MAG: tRNA (adenosine(37)-N6)-threonylcarbamoyltransferase complex dimerization subunit type 1 TsaB [Chloroflexota bacterium]
MLLAFDTATQTASIAIYNPETDELLGEYTWLARRKQTQDLLSTTQLMMQQLALSPSSITGLSVTTGPGSFTGVRIGISAVKGIGLGLPVTPQVIGIPTLSVTAAAWYTCLNLSSMGQLKYAFPGQDADELTKVRICPYIQAGRGRYNWVFTPNSFPLAIPSTSNESTDTVSRPTTLWRPERSEHFAGSVSELVHSLMEQAPRTILVVGEETEELRDAVSKLSHIQMMDPISGMRRAGQLARLAASHFAAGQGDTLADLQPLYLRNP